MHTQQIQAFFGKDGPQKLIFFHQVEELEVNPGEFQASKSAQKGLFLTDGEHQRARGRSDCALHAFCWGSSHRGRLIWSMALMM